MVAVRLNEALEQLRSEGSGSSLRWSADGRNCRTSTKNCQSRVGGSGVWAQSDVGKSRATG